MRVTAQLETLDDGKRGVADGKRRDDCLSFFDHPSTILRCMAPSEIFTVLIGQDGRHGGLRFFVWLLLAAVALER